MRPYRLIAATLAAAAALTLLAGCWDNREPRRRAYVLGMGIDQDQQDPTRLTVTLQLPVPFRIGGGGGGGQSAGGGGADYFLIQGTGTTLVDALQTAQDRISRDLFLGQMRVIALSSQLSGAQYRRVTDEIRRNPDVEETVYLLVARGRADALLGQRSPQERLPALYLNSAFEAVRRLTVLEPVRIWEYWRAYHASGREPILPVAEPVGQGEIRLSGLAVFRGHEFRGFLDPDEAQGYLWLTGRTNNRVFSLQTERGLVAVRSLRVARSVSVRFAGDRPTFFVAMRMTGEVALPARQPVEASDLAFLEAVTATEVRRQVAAAIRKIRDEFSSDVFGLGSLLFYRYPAYFARVDWEKEFPEIGIEYSVAVRLHRKGAVH